MGKLKIFSISQKIINFNLEDKNLMQLQSKAKTLKWLSKKLTLFSIPELTYIYVNEWRSDSKNVISKIQKKFCGRTLIVRSSANNEDRAENSMAGAYVSVLNISSHDKFSLKNAINEVIESYNSNNKGTSDDHVIIQEMVRNTTMSGVVFTHDLNTGAPYYVINYDDVSGLTNTVTSGEGKYANRTLHVYRDAAKSLRSPRFKKLIDAINELENIIGSEFLDIEFALTNDFNPHLLQVRKITTQTNWNKKTLKQINLTLEGIKKFVKSRLSPCSGIYGSSTVFGQMPDWNPAEMIGRAPRSLAFSLYEKFITDDTWRVARKLMGYSVPIGQPLMVSLSGQPFIDTRLSFHSYLPSDLDPKISSKIVDKSLYVLKENPQLHDKVEFEVAITAYSFDINQKIERMFGDTINKKECILFKKELKKQTIKLMSNCPIGGIKSANTKINLLEIKQREFSKRKKNFSILYIYELIDDCIQLGTIPFSILARHAFIARTLVNSLVNLGILSQDDLNNFLGNIPTIASEFVNDMSKLQSNPKEYDDFMKKYGHLRPGTYDILSMRYDQMKHSIIPDNLLQKEKNLEKKFSFNFEQIKAVEKLLINHGFKGINAKQFFSYIKESIIGREYAKFIFSKSISEILEFIAKYGEKNGINRHQLSHIPIETILKTINKSTKTKIKDFLSEQAILGEDNHVISSTIRLPQVLFDEAGVHVIPFQISEPNYITKKRISAPTVSLLLEHNKKSIKSTLPSLTDKIILIESADPGFDWIFAQGIAGLVTKYGGANSHMAIRCAEFNIPAAIGCGEQRFDMLLKSKNILLDCSTRIIRDELAN